MENGFNCVTKYSNIGAYFTNINHSLVSIGNLCDAGFTVTLKIKYVIVVYKDEIILQEWRNHQNKLRYFPLSVKNED